jgi:hypothetical protein
MDLNYIMFVFLMNNLQIKSLNFRLIESLIKIIFVFNFLIK